MAFLALSASDLFDSASTDARVPPFLLNPLRRSVSTGIVYGK